MKKVKYVKYDENEKYKIYSFISYLREDWVERSIVIKTDFSNLIKKIYITSNKYGTVEWTNGFGLSNCKSWEDHDAPPVSALSKHYNVRLANGEMTLQYALDVIIPDVLDHTVDMIFSNDMFSILKEKKLEIPFNLEQYNMREINNNTDEGNEHDDEDKSDPESVIEKSNILERINYFINKRKKIKEVINKNSRSSDKKTSDSKLKFEKFTVFLFAIISIVIIIAVIIHIIDLSTLESTVKKSSEVLDLEESAMPFKEILDASEYPDFSLPPAVRIGSIEYPDLAKSMDINATVITRITIDENGNVLYVDVLEILLNKVLPLKLTRVIESEFSDATNGAYMSSKYAPFYHNGEKTPVRFIISVVFNSMEENYFHGKESIKL